MTVDTFTGIINQLLPEPHAGLLSGILFGTKAAIPKDFYNALVTTGTLHIVALSGMNISILVSLIADTLLRFVSRRITSLLTVVIIIGFVWFVGAGASVVRAAIMGCMALLAVIFGRQLWSFFSYLITVGVMLLVRPAWITDLSFQLSALATLGIILFGKTEHKKIVDKKIEKINMSFLYHVISDDLRTTLAAQVFTVPLIFLTFHRISLISPLTNILIGWVIPPLTSLGLAVAILGWVWLPAGQVLAWFAWALTSYLITVIELTAKIPFASIGN